MPAELTERIGENHPRIESCQGNRQGRVEDSVVLAAREVEATRPGGSGTLDG